MLVWLFREIKQQGGEASMVMGDQRLLRHFVRVVKELDSKSIGLCPRRFKSCRCRHLFTFLFVWRALGFWVWLNHNTVRIPFTCFISILLLFSRLLCFFGGVQYAAAFVLVRSGNVGMGVRIQRRKENGGWKGAAGGGGEEKEENRGEGKHPPAKKEKR